jgi:hypothetical protein
MLGESCDLDLAAAAGIDTSLVGASIDVSDDEDAGDTQGSSTGSQPTPPPQAAPLAARKPPNIHELLARAKAAPPVQLGHAAAGAAASSWEGPDTGEPDVPAAAAAAAASTPVPAASAPVPAVTAAAAAAATSVPADTVRRPDVSMSPTIVFEFQF